MRDVNGNILLRKWYPSVTAVSILESAIDQEVQIKDGHVESNNEESPFFGGGITRM